jgi:hypothetical protein
MEGPACLAEEIPAPEQVHAVVHVATVGGAAAGTDQSRPAELPQVVRHQVLRLLDELHELAHPSVAATELGDQLPSQWIAERPEDLWGLGRCHGDHYIRLS